MLLIALGVLLYAGFVAKKFRLAPFGFMLIFAAIGVGIANISKADALSRLGEDPAKLWRADVLAINIASNFILYSIFYMIGFGIGAIRRRRQLAMLGAQKGCNPPPPEVTPVAAAPAETAKAP